MRAFVFLCAALFVLCAPRSTALSLPIGTGYSGTEREFFYVTARLAYHGIDHAFREGGQWVFRRGGQICRL
jgi:hypothetical protein